MMMMKIRKVSLKVLSYFLRYDPCFLLLYTFVHRDGWLDRSLSCIHRDGIAAELFLWQAEILPAARVSAHA